MQNLKVIFLFPITTMDLPWIQGNLLYTQTGNNFYKKIDFWKINDKLIFLKIKIKSIYFFKQLLPVPVYNKLPLIQGKSRAITGNENVICNYFFRILNFVLIFFLIFIPENKYHQFVIYF